MSYLPLADPRLLKVLQRRFSAQANIERPVEVDDGSGGVTTTWTLLASVAGVLQPMTAEEALARGGEQATSLFTWWMAYRTDVTPNMRLHLGTRIFDVAAVTDVGEQHVITTLDLRERFPQ